MTVAPEPSGRSRCDHLVQVYRDVSELAEAVATFFGAGFEAGDAALAIVTPEHFAPVVEKLAARGWMVDRLEADGRLLVLDAEETLGEIVEDARPSRARFDRVVGAALDRVENRAPGCKVRAFGEMVDILCLQGRPDAADALEVLWNGLASRREFSLLCGYRVDIFEPDSQLRLLPQIYRAHSRVLPPVDPQRLERAVDEALVAVLGAGGAKKVHAQVAQQARREDVSNAHLSLLWVSSHMPRTAKKILAEAQARYLGAASNAA